MSLILTELEDRWSRVFADLAAGRDLPPGARLRAEGLMEAAVLVGEGDQTAIQAAMDRCYRTAFGRGLEEDFGPAWQAFYPFPQIPAVARRAPVFPSTAD